MQTVFVGVDGMCYINAYDARKPHECPFERLCPACYQAGVRVSCKHCPPPTVRWDDCEGEEEEENTQEPPQEERSPWEMHALYLQMLGLQKHG